MKIAIIGSGVSGLASAYLLSPYHDVTVYEKQNRLGGHAHSITFKEGSKTFTVDNGFMVYNPDQYPNFVKLLDELKVESLDTTMSFSLDIPGEISYSSELPNGLFANRSNLLNIRFLKFLYGITKFRRIAKKALLSKQNLDQTLDDFLNANRISVDVVNWFLFPTLSAIWSVKEAEQAGDFPAISTFRFLDNHRLLNTTQPKWKTIKGGSIQYVKKIQRFIEKHGTKIILSANVTSIKRNKDGVKIVVNGKIEEFDYVILATHADTAEKLLSDATNVERHALKQFSYSNNTTVLHKDARLVSDNPRMLAAWNYTQTKNKVTGITQTSFSYCMNILQHIPHETPVFVTLNPKIVIDTNRVYAVEEYSHPQYNLSSLRGQEEISKIQGIRNTFYAGAHLGYGFHEDGVASAIRVAEMLNIEPPWNDAT